MGLLKLGSVAIDGTKVKADASRHQAISHERMKQAEIERRETRLAAIREARERLEHRQREADLQRGRGDDDDRRPRGPDGKPKGRRYKREFGVPEARAQENFTDPDSRIMKRAGAGSIRPATSRERAEVPAVQHEGASPGAGRMEARVHGAEPAAHGSAQRG